jgi:hypothetical protein
MGWRGKMSAAKTMTGQCHRYQEYDASPMATIGRTARPRFTPRVDQEPAQITKAVPATGIRASSPGKDMLSRIVKAARAIRAAPTSPVRRVLAADTRGRRVSSSARRAPTANSQERVNGL